MPIKEFKCNDCEHEFEEYLFNSEVKALCPECSSDNLKALVTAHGGYSGNMGGSSTRPRGSGSFKGKVKK